MYKSTSTPVNHLVCWAIAVLSATALSQAHAQQADAAKGSALFATHCSECHSLKQGKDKKGPSLYAMLGTKAAQRENFAYSDALKGSGLVWDAPTLSRYMANPKATVPGGKMKYDGLESAAERSDLIAFIAASQGK